MRSLRAGIFHASVSAMLLSSEQTVDLTPNTAGSEPSGVDRPLINEYWPALAIMTEASWDNPATLQIILAELLFRSREGAKKLRTKISERFIELSEESFLWPDTGILPSSEALSGDQFWYQDGLLSFMGYRVGSNGVSAGNRRDILDYIYCQQIPRVNNAGYMEQWGTAQSSPRLQKMADCLAAFARNAKRRSFVDMSCAIADWEADLEYLRTAFYIGRYDFAFAWPLTYLD